MLSSSDNNTMIILLYIIPVVLVVFTSSNSVLNLERDDWGWLEFGLMCDDNIIYEEYADVKIKSN